MMRSHCSGFITIPEARRLGNADQNRHRRDGYVCGGLSEAELSAHHGMNENCTWIRLARDNE